MPATSRVRPRVFPRPSECSTCANYSKVNRQLALLCDALLNQLRENGIEPQFEPLTSNLAEAQARLNQSLARAA